MTRRCLALVLRGLCVAPLLIVVASYSPAHATLQYGWGLGQECAYTFTIEAEIAKETRKWQGTNVYRVDKADAVKSAESEPDTASGTGFIVAENGYLITCAHVVKGTAKIEVVLGEKKYPAEIVEMDNDHDIALVRCKADHLPVLPLADSEGVELAQEVRVVGFPLSTVLGNSIKISRGTISGVINENGKKTFQVDAGVNPGNSGGPLVNEQGQVVGVVSAKLTGESVTNVGFVQPVNYARVLLQRHSVPFQAAAGGTKLDGPDLAKRVVPAVPQILVTMRSKSLDYRNLIFRSSLKALPRRGQPVDPRANVTEEGFLVVNRQGEVIKPGGEKELPFCLGSLSQVGVEQLSPDEQSWQVERVTSVTQTFEDSGIKPPPGQRTARNARGPTNTNTTVVVHPALERTRYEIIESRKDGLVIKKTYELKTIGKAGEPPYLSVSGSGTLNFLHRSGSVPENLDFKGTLELRDRTSTVTIPIKLTYRLVDPSSIDRSLLPKGSRVASSAATPASSAPASTVPKSSPGESEKSSPPKLAHPKHVGEPFALPEQADIQKARTLVDELFESELAAAKGSAKKLDLARSLLKQAFEQEEGLPEHYVLLDKAREMAAAGGDAPLTSEIIDHLISCYRLKATALKTEALTTLAEAASTNDQQKAIAETALVWIDEAIEAERLSAAKKFGSLALAAARKSKDNKLIKRVSDRGKEFKRLQKNLEEAQQALAAIEKDPDDPAANTSAGKYFCFVKDNWQRGLPLLAKGDDATLHGLAEQETAIPDSGSAKLAVADGWWGVADGEQGERKTNVLAHARDWYEKALPDLSGLSKTKAQKRLSDTSVASAAPTTSAKEPPTTDADGKPLPAGVVARLKMFQQIKTAISEGRAKKSTEVGWTAGKQEYTCLPDQGALLVGLEVSHNGNTVTALRPVFLGPKGQFSGPLCGVPNAQAMKIMARKGYAVGAVKAKGGFGLSGFSITFMEIQGDALNPEKSYETPWIGGGTPDSTLGGDGEPVIGIFGHGGGSEVSSFGLILGEK